MALINCPECEKEISDTVDKCINCGFVLKKQEEIEKKTVCPRIIGRSGFTGVFCIIFSIFGFLLSFALPILGIFTGLGMIIMFFCGLSMFTKSLEITCLNCNNENIIPFSETKCKCKFCNKMYVKDGEYFRLLD